MKRSSLRCLGILAVGLMLLSGCGGGGGTSAVALPAAQPVAIVTLSTEITGTIPAGTTINSYEVTMTLPQDTTCKSTANPPQTDAGVVTLIGSAATAGSFVTGVYTAATAGIPGKVKISIASTNGFGPGAFCTVRCELANGVQPTATDFRPLTLDSATGIDSVGSSVFGLESQLAVTASVAIQ